MDETRIYYSLENKPLKEIVSVGQRVYIIPANNRARYIKDSMLNHAREATVEKVGRKYFYVDGIKFEISCGYIRESSDYSSSYHLILSDEDLNNARLNTKVSDIISRFSGYNSSKMDSVSIDDKIAIAEILKKYLS